MLIITRKKGDSFHIKVGDKEIVINILDNNAGNVKIGIDAPREYKILRGELYSEIVSQNKNSTEFTDEFVDSFKDMISSVKKE
ncbi:MAG TPA: carbon storage regulator [Tepiditoga sp.]|nr:carbon storage regulator [Thermotogota bacterium]HOO73893.1 carbon storage regulator [Tepiditoga sp.]